MKFGRKTKGVISIFLLITFSTVFIFSGILVDGGRMHMARALATSSLDNAASSALSYYDKLLLDLYGLFATVDQTTSEEELQKKIKNRMEKYFRQTMGLVTTDEDTTDIMVGKLMESFDGYAFQVEEFSAGSSLNLGQTEVLKTQIVEHMKFRAPLQLVNVEYGFLDDLKKLLDMKDILKITQDKQKIIKKYENAIYKGNELVNLIIDYLRVTCKTYCDRPINGGTVSAYLEKTVTPKLQSFYDEYKAICEAEEQAQSSGTEDNSTEVTGVEERNVETEQTQETTAESTEATTTAEDYAQQKQDVLDRMGAYLKGDSNSVLATLESDVHTKANDLMIISAGYKLRVDAYLKDIKQYIKELQDFAGLSEKNKSLTENDIITAKAAAGKVTLNMGILSNAEDTLRDIREIEDDTKIEFYVDVYQNMKQKFETRTFQSDEACRYMQGHSYIKTIEEKLKKLSQKCDASEEKYIDTNTSPHYKTTSEKTSEKLGVNSEALRTDIRENGITEGATDTSSNGGNDGFYEFDVPTDSDAEAADALLDNGMKLLDSLSQFFENGISNIYINEYIMAYCRDYVHHYNMIGDKTVDENGDITGDKDKYDRVIAKQFCAESDKNTRYIVSEIEYILAGNNNEYTNVMDVSGRIMLIRIVCNLAGMLMDSTMYQQANLLSVWAGPLQPLVAFALMVAWVVAESAVDVVHIMKGEMVLLYKKGKDWSISAAGIIEEIAGEAVEFAANAALGKVEELTRKGWNAFEQQYDAAVYDLYMGNTSEIGFSIENKNDPAGKMMDMLGTFQYSCATAKKEEALKLLSEQYSSLKRQGITNLKKITMRKTQNMNFGFDGSNAESSDIKVKLGYTDYLRLLLLLEDETTKLQRLQEVIQMNIRYQQHRKGVLPEEQFQMRYAWVNVYAEADCSIRYLFMTETFLPSTWLEEAGRDGRYHFKVQTNITY